MGTHQEAQEQRNENQRPRQKVTQLQHPSCPEKYDSNHTQQGNASAQNVRLWSLLLTFGTIQHDQPAGNSTKQYLNESVEWVEALRVEHSQVGHCLRSRGSLQQ